MIQKVGFSAGNWQKEIATTKAIGHAITQQALKEMMTSVNPLKDAPKFIELSPRGQFAGAVHHGNGVDILTLTPRGQFKDAIFKK